MTQYQNKSFSVAVGSKAYRDGWDAIFNKKPRNLGHFDNMGCIPADVQEGDLMHMCGKWWSYVGSGYPAWMDVTQEEYEALGLKTETT